MLTYTFSRREKALLLVLAAILVVVAWFMLVFQRTTDQINSIEADIASVDASTTVATAQVNRMHTMQKAIDKYKEQGAKSTPIPTFDNMTPLMSALNATMSSAATYSLSFDELDTKTSQDYILRGVTVDYSCDSISAAEQIVTSLARGAFPCSIDSVSITDGSVKTGSRVSTASGAAPVSASVHVTFFEKPPSARPTA